jgi:hypothetical protein
MRSLLALVLLGAVSAHECPIAGIISWLKEHGEEVLETLDECKDVPSILRNFKQEVKGCYAEKSTADKAALGLWYAITGLEHINGTIGEFVKHSPMIERIKRLATRKSMASTHESVAKMCGSAKCEDKVVAVQSTIASCYASLSCNFMGKLIPFTPCKVAMDKYMKSAMALSMQSMCQSDVVRGKTFYCSELNQGGMMRDVDCFWERTRMQECTPKCKKEWTFAKRVAPKCSKVLTDMPEHMMKNVKTMFEDMAKDAKIDMSDIVKHLPEHLPTYDDKCGQPKELSEVMV